MSKKVLSVLLAVAMMVTMLCVAGVSASASDAKTMVGGTIYFEVPEDWGELTKTTGLYAHIWVNAGEELAAWQTKAEKMTLVEGRTYKYEIKKAPAEADSPDWNMVIFSMYGGPQTYDMTMGVSCIGDTAYVTGEIYESPVDSNKTALVARWKNDKTQGPHVIVTSIGNVVGTNLLPGETKEDVLSEFIKNYPSIATDEKVAEVKAKLDELFPDSPEPTTGPTDGPTVAPTDEPTTTPTQQPTVAPTDPTDPTDKPTVAPTDPTDSTEPTTDKYGRERGIPIPADIKMPEQVTQPNGQPGSEEHPDWDGYYRIYYFEAPDEWLENAQYKDKDFEIGFYWFYGTENNGEWPGERATKLALDGVDNIYYAIAPSYANNIIWNNGINGGLSTAEDFDPAKKAAAKQTSNLNVEDEMFNNLGVADSCGNLASLNGKTITTTNELTHEVQTTYECDWAFFNPLTGDTTTKGLTVDGEEMLDENGLPMNPYFDMDYSYVRPTPVPPIVPPTSATIPSEEPTTAPTGGNKAPGTVNTAQDVAMFFVLATILLAAAGVVVIARRKRAQG